MNYTKHTIMVDGFPVKVYVHKDRHQAYIFPLFGRYNGLWSDQDVLDFATTFLLCAGRNDNVVSFQSYLNSQEDTAVININDLKAS